MLKRFGVFVLGLSLANSALAQKRKITVMDFGYGTVKTSVQSMFGTDQDIGKGISDLLINQLLQAGNYRIIERSALEKIIAEQNFSNGDRVNPASAAKIGGLLGVDAMIIGDITTFGHDDKKVGGGGGGGSWYQSMGGAVSVSKNKTIVEITARIVDVNTGEILASVTGRGETSKSGVGLGGGGHDGWKGGAGALNMSSSNFAETEIGKAVKLSVTELANNLDSKAASLPAPSGPVVAALPPLEGVVADASGGEIIINVGAKKGVKLGDTLAVTRVDRVINDPVTGKVLRTVETAVGVISVTSVDADSAVGKFTGAGKPVVGDHIKRPATN